MDGISIRRTGIAKVLWRKLDVEIPKSEVIANRWIATTDSLIHCDKKRTRTRAGILGPRFPLCVFSFFSLLLLWPLVRVWRCITGNEEGAGLMGGQDGDFGYASPKYSHGGLTESPTSYYRELTVCYCLEIFYAKIWKLTLLFIITWISIIYI